jgi:hypothetical protein
LMPMVHWFGLLMESLSSWIYLLQLLSPLCKSFCIFNIYFVFKSCDSVMKLF